MDELVKRGLSAYKIFLKNKIASSVMMFISGIMMLIAAINGKGNDTKSLPTLITSIGVILSLYGAFRLGYIKSHFDELKKTTSAESSNELKAIIFQVGETLIYMAVAGVGVFLLSNEDLTDKALNLMTGGFTTLNGVLGAINAYKKRDDKDFRWKMLLFLTVLELVMGLFFIFASDSIAVFWYIVMGALTTVAGVIEVVSAINHGQLDSTIDDGKKILTIIKNGDSGDHGTNPS